MTESALSGYRIIDLTDAKGLLCSRLLAEMGAETIRVDKPGTRDLPLWENLGKKSITLDVESAAGRQLLDKLLKTADAVVESYSPNEAKRLQLDYHALSTTFPKLIVASVTGFGQAGPRRDWKSSDLVAAALGGQVYVSGESDMPPLKLYGNQVYHSASLYAAIGILLALRNRRETGKGDHIDISLQECAASMLDHVLVHYFYQGEIAQRQGSRYWNGAFDIFPCRDGYVLLSLVQGWETLVEWIAAEGKAEDLGDPSWLDAEARAEHAGHITEVLARWTMSHTAAELVETAQAMRYPWAKVVSIPELLNSPQLIERGFLGQGKLPGSEASFQYPAAPCRLSASPWKTENRPAVPGEYNLEIYRKLGLSENDIETLGQQGII